MARSRDRILDATTELGLSEGRAVDEATAELGQQAPVTDPLEAEAQAAGPFRRGLRGGALGLASTFESFVGQTGLAMGMDEFAQRRFAEAEKYIEDSQKIGMPIKDSTAVRDFADLTQFVSQSVGQAFGSTLPLVGASLLTKHPVFATAALSGIAEGGEQVQTLREDPEGKKLGAGELLGHAAAKGAVGGLLEVGSGAGRLARGLSKQGLRRAADKGFKETVKEAPKELLKSGVGESVTETLQQGAGEFGRQIVNPEHEIDTAQLRESAIVGGIGGLALGGIGVGANVSLSAFRDRMAKDRVPTGENDVPPGSEGTTDAEELSRVLSESDGVTDDILAEAAQLPENEQFRGYTTDPEIRSQFVASERRKVFGKRFDEGLRSVQKTEIEERTPMDDEVHKVMMEHVLPEFKNTASPESLLAMSQSIRQLLQEPSGFKNPGVLRGLRKVFGDKTDAFLEAAAGRVFSNREGRRQAISTIKSATGESTRFGNARMQQVQRVLRQNLGAQFLADPNLRRIIDEELAPQMMDFIEGQGEYNKRFVAAMQEVFGEKTENVLDQLDALREEGPQSILEKDLAPTPEFQGDPRLDKRYEHRGEAEDALEGLRTSYPPHLARFVVQRHGDNEYTIEVEDPDTFKLGKVDFESIKEPKQFGDHTPEQGVFTIKREGGYQNKLSAPRLVKLMMKTQRQQSREGTLKFVSDMFGRGISALMSMPEFKGLKVPEFSDNLYLGTFGGRKITYGMIRNAEFPQNKTARELRKGIRKTKKGTPQREKALDALGEYYEREQQAADITQPLVEGALDDLAEGASLAEALEPLIDMQARFVADEIIKPTREGGKQQLVPGDPEWRRLKRAIEYVMARAEEADATEALQVEREELGTTRRSQDRKGARIVEEETRLPVGQERRTAKKQETADQEIYEESQKAIERQLGGATRDTLVYPMELSPGGGHGIVRADEVLEQDQLDEINEARKLRKDEGLTAKPREAVGIFLTDIKKKLKRWIKNNWESQVEDIRKKVGKKHVARARELLDDLNLKREAVKKAAADRGHGMADAMAEYNKAKKEYQTFQSSLELELQNAVFGEANIKQMNDEVERVLGKINTILKLEPDTHPGEGIFITEHSAIQNQIYDVISIYANGAEGFGRTWMHTLHHEIGHAIVGRMTGKYGKDHTAKILELARQKKIIETIKKNYSSEMWSHWLEAPEELFVQAYAMWATGELVLPKSSKLKRVFSSILEFLGFVAPAGEKLSYMFEKIHEGHFREAKPIDYRDRIQDPRFLLVGVEDGPELAIMRGRLVDRLEKQFGKLPNTVIDAVQSILTGRQYEEFTGLIYSRDEFSAILEKENPELVDKYAKDVKDPEMRKLVIMAGAYHASAEVRRSIEEFGKSLWGQEEGAAMRGIFSKVKLGTDTVTEQQKKDVREYVEKVLGKDMAIVVFSKMEEAGEFIGTDAIEMLRISMNAADPMSVARHEAMHAFFKRLLAHDAKAARVLKNAANATPMVARLRELLKDEPDALNQLDDPVERLAYMYQFWASGQIKMPVGPETLTWFDKVKTVFRKITAIWTDDVQLDTAIGASELMHAFHEGRFADRNTFAQVLNNEKPMASREAADRVWPALGSFLDKWLYTATGAVRDYGYEPLTKVMDDFHIKTGTQGQRPGFLQEKHTVYNSFLNRVAKAIATMSEADQQEIVSAMRENRPTRPDLESARAEVRKVLDELYDYLQESGVKTIVREEGRVKRDEFDNPIYKDLQKVKNYFPRVFNLQYVRDNRQAFLDLLKKYNIAHAEQIYSNIVGDINMLGNSQGDETLNLTFYAPFTQERTMTAIPEAELAPFLENNLFGIMSQYTARAARRGEYTSRFGNSGEEILKARQEAKEQGATERQLETFDNAVKAMEGTLGADMSPQLRAAFGAVTTYQNIRLLPLALFSSIVDPLGIVVRGGTFGEATKAFFRGIRELVGTMKDDKAGLAALVGAINTANDVQVVTDMYSSQFMSPTLKKINELFFKYNGMENWNKSMRISASAAAQQFILRHAKGVNEHSERFLKELNLTKEDVQTHPDGSLILNDNMRAAINLWVDQAILRPNAALRPIYMSDPNWILVSHLKQYTYLFQQTIINRMAGELGHGNYTPALGLISYVPVIIMSDMLRSILTPNAGDDHDDWDGADWLMRGVQRAGIYGPGQIALDTGQDMKYGGGLSLLGPSAEQLMNLTVNAFQGDTAGLLKDFQRATPGVRYF